MRRYYHRYGLAEITASISQSQFHTAADMQSIEIGDHGYIFVIDSDGIIRIHPDNSVTGSDVSNENWFLSLEKQSEGWLVYSMQKEPHLAMWAYFEPWDWYILATYTEIEIYSAINRMRTFILLLSTMGSLLIALVLMLVTLKLTRPLRLLEAGAVQIGQVCPHPFIFPRLLQNIRLPFIIPVLIPIRYPWRIGNPRQRQYGHIISFNCMWMLSSNSFSVI